MSQDKNRSGRSDKRYFSGLCVCAGVSFIIIALANAVISIYWGIGGIPETYSVEPTLLSTGIGTIGLALTVWAGLNISNIVSRKEVDELKEEVETLKGITEFEIRPFADQNRATLLQQFIVELERKQEDPIAQYFLAEIRNIPENEGGIPYAILIEIEMLITQVALRHRSKYAYDETLIKLADQGLDRIRQVQGCDRMKQYLVYREADFMFYKGYCDKDRIESTNDFLNVANAIRKKLTYDTIKTELRNDESTLAYLDNMLGETYSKIVHYYTDVSKKEEREKLEQVLDENLCQIDKIADMAVRYCKAAVDRKSTSMYCRNLGCAYERKARLIALNGGEKFAYSTEIIEAYYQSVSLTLKDYAIDQETCRKAFRVLLIYYHKYLTDKIERSACIRLTYEECAELISKMYVYAYIATLDFPRDMAFRKLYAFSCHYVCQALELNIRIAAARGKSQEFFEGQIKDTWRLLEFADTQDGKMDDFTAKLRTILEVMG